jgi:hypothetical protein
MVIRFRRALPALAGGLVLGCAAAAAAADAPPPAAPIFYCPSTPQKTPSPACKPLPGTPAARAPAAQHVAVVEHRNWRHHRYEHHYAVRLHRPEDVSASQAFIYRYERAQHGLDARAADEAWDHAPPPAHYEAPPPHHEWAEAPPAPHVIVEHAPPAPQQVIVERAPPPPQQVIIEREAPPLPKVIIEHAPAPPPRVIFERAPAPPPVYYGREEREDGGGYAFERRETERAGGWSYSEQDGRGHYESWGDARPHRHGCPPQVVEAGGCAAAAYAEHDSEWRDGSYGHVYQYSGRDAYGYLVWPGKTPGAP